MKAFVLAALFGVAMVAAAEMFAAVDISASGLGSQRDGSAALNGDTPVRQAQRERRAERVAAGADAVGGVSLMETGASTEAGVDRYRGANGPALNRLTGAAKTFHPNDQMCVMCQYFVQKVQLDMAHFNVLGGFLGIKAAGANGAKNAATGGADAGEKAEAEGAFLEVGTSFGADDESADWAAEDAEEAAALEIAAKQELAEQDGDWDAVALLDQKSHAIETVVEEIDAEDKAVAGDEDEDESEDEAEDESEEAEGDAFEEEEGSEQALAKQLAASSFQETDAHVVTAGLSAQEQAEMAEVEQEMRNDKIAAAVHAQIAEGMETTPVLVESAAAAASDADESAEGEAEAEVDAELAASLDSQLTLSSDEEADLVSSMQGKDSADEEDAFTTPAYNADGQAGAMDSTEATTTAIDVDNADEDLALLQVAADDEAEADDEAVAEANADAEADEELSEGIAENVQFVEVAANPAAPRSYARVAHRTEHEPVEPALAEVSGTHAAFQSAGGLARVNVRDCRRKIQRVKRCSRIENTRRRRCQIIRRKAPRPEGCPSGRRTTLGIANSPRRFRLADALHSRPRWNRWDPTVKPHPDPNRAKAREMWHHLMQMTYDRLEGYCSTRLPEQFTPFCRPLLRRFRVVAEGIRYGDRPNQICMRTRFCPRGSYVRRSPHNVFKHIRTCDRGRC